MKLLALTALSLISISQTYSEEISERDYFKDKKTGRYVHVCKSEGDVLQVAEYCSRFEDTKPRKRSDLNKLIHEYKDVKKNDHVMIYVMRDGEPQWVLGTVNTMLEDGTIHVMEYYSHHGLNTGTLNWSVPYSNISKVISTPEASTSEVCAKENFEILAGHYNEKKYKIEKGEKMTVQEIYANGILAVKLEGVLVNLVRYGHNNKLPVPPEKVEICPRPLAENDGPRSLKPVQDDGAGSPSSSSSKSKEK